jgi:hypothetical protein
MYWMIVTYSTGRYDHVWSITVYKTPARSQEYIRSYDEMDNLSTHFYQERIVTWRRGSARGNEISLPE